VGSKGTSTDPGGCPLREDNIERPSQQQTQYKKTLRQQREEKNVCNHLLNQYQSNVRNRLENGLTISE
jgi:hypothetical protein